MVIPHIVIQVPQSQLFHFNLNFLIILQRIIVFLLLLIVGLVKNFFEMIL